MNIDNIKVQAELDTAIDVNHLEEESVKVPQIHNKYLEAGADIFLPHLF